MRSITIIILLAGMVVGACAPRTTSRTSKKIPEIEEDLSEFRPKYKVSETQARKDLSPEVPKANAYPEPRLDLTGPINSMLDSIAERNQRINAIEGIQGYTILIRGGQLEEAISIRQRIMNLFPNANPELLFDRPIYKVKVGRFFSKIEANKLFTSISKEFPNRVILAPEKIYLQ